MTFIGKAHNTMHSAHLNGVRTDNRLENLKWVTPKENTFHRIAHGTMSINVGPTNPNSTISDDDVIGIRWLYSKGFALTEIGHMLNMRYGTVHKIVNKAVRAKCGEKLK